MASATTTASEAKRSGGASAAEAWTAAASGYFRIALAPPRQAVGWMRGCGAAGVGR